MGNLGFLDDGTAKKIMEKGKGGGKNSLQEACRELDEEQAVLINDGEDVDVDSELLKKYLG